MAREYDFTSHVRRRVTQRQMGQCGCCGDSLQGEDYGHHVIPHQSKVAENRLNEFLRSEDNCVVVCADCHYVVHAGNMRTGAVAPPEYFPYSHGSANESHARWTMRVNRQWEEMYPMSRTPKQNFADTYVKVRMASKSPIHLSKMQTQPDAERSWTNLRIPVSEQETQRRQVNLRPWSDADTVRVRDCLSRAIDPESSRRQFEELKQLAAQVDFRSETNGYHVLYAKTNITPAKDFTEKVDGYKILDQTAAGIAFDSIYKSASGLSDTQKKEVFGVLSERFVQDARGTLVVFDRGYPEGIDPPPKSTETWLDYNVRRMSLAHTKESAAFANNPHIERVVYNPHPPECHKGNYETFNYKTIDYKEFDYLVGWNPASRITTDKLQLPLQSIHTNAIAFPPKETPTVPQGTGTPQETIATTSKLGGGRLQSSSQVLAPEALPQPRVVVPDSKAVTERQLVAAQNPAPEANTSRIAVVNAPNMEFNRHPVAPQVPAPDMEMQPKMVTSTPKAEAGQQTRPSSVQIADVGLTGKGAQIPPRVEHRSSLVPSVGASTPVEKVPEIKSAQTPRVAPAQSSLPTPGQKLPVPPSPSLPETKAIPSAPKISINIRGPRKGNGQGME